MSLLFSTGAIAGSAAKGAPGMVLLTPTSITHSGTSASIGANGQVTFTAVTSLSLNGCFSADFDNYMVSIRYVAAGGNAGGDGVNLRFRAAGSDAGGSDYTRQLLNVRNASIGAARVSDNFMTFGFISDEQRTGDLMYFYGPYLAQPTAGRSVSATGREGGSIYDFAGTHNLSTSYDGFTLIANAGNMTGALQVYGLRS